MAGAPTIWVSDDLSERIADYRGEYIFISMNDMKQISLGKTLEEAIEKLKEHGRYDIVKQLK